MTTMIPARVAYRYQSGTALIFSLIILLVLTILGVSAMRTTALEQIMAGNTQELTRTFHAADTGLAKAMDDMRRQASGPNSNYDLALWTFNASDYIFGTAVAEPAIPTSLSSGKGSRPTPASGVDFCYAFHNQPVTGRGLLNANTTLQQGLSKLIPSDPSSPSSDCS